MSEPKPSDRSSPSLRRSKRQVVPGKHAQADGLELRSYDVGALPLLNRIVERVQLQRILSEHLPKDDSRTELPTVTALLVLFANLLMAREPVYGVGEWAALFPPDLLGLREQDLTRMAVPEPVSLCFHVIYAETQTNNLGVSLDAVS